MDDATLDPKDWNALRASAHDMLDRALDRLENARQGDVWTPLPEARKKELRAELPTSGLAHSDIVEKLSGLLPAEESTAARKELGIDPQKPDPAVT